MNVGKATQLLKVVGALSLLASAVVLFNWPDVTPYVLAGTVCLVLFMSIVAHYLIESMSNEPNHGEFDPPHLPRPPSLPKTGSSVTSTPRTTPLPPPPGDTQQDPPPVSHTLSTDTDWSLLMPTMDHKGDPIR